VINETIYKFKLVEIASKSKPRRVSTHAQRFHVRSELIELEFTGWEEGDVYT
jgi:hypothetical protein